MIEAVAKYSDCIDEGVWMDKEGTVCQPGNFYNVLKLAYSNRAESLLQLQNLEGALSDAEKALNLNPAHVKSLCRLGRAARELGLYKKACQAFKTALELSPNENLIAEELQSSQDFLEQSRSGTCVIDPVFSIQNCCEKYAEYIVPVEICRVCYSHCGSKFGRGLFAKEVIKACSIILVNNMMAAAERDPADNRMIVNGPPRDVDPDHMKQDTLSYGDEYDVLVQLIQQAAGSKRSMAQLYSLAPGEEGKVDIPSMELFELGSQWAPPSSNDSAVDVKLIKKIIKVNFFGTNKASQGRSDTVLYILPSFINHSCAPNSLKGFAGNVMLTHATRNIVAVEEITISYFENLFAGVDARQEQARRLRFTCECERCHLEKELDPEFSVISAWVRGLVSDSKREFHHDFKGFVALVPSLGLSRAKIASLTVKEGKQDWGWESLPGVNKLFVATRQLAKLAKRVETLIGLLDSGIAAHERAWIRAGFLEAYLAKHA